MLSPTTRAQIDSATRVAARLSTPYAARRAGYRRIAPRNSPDLNPMVGEHWLYAPYLRGNRLDVARPAYLMFYPTVDGEERLVGTAYAVTQPASAPAPAGFSGPADVWHVHLPCGHLPQLRTTLVGSAAKCRALGGDAASHQIAMVHVWFEPVNPEGPFAADNVALPYFATNLAPPTGPQLRDPTRASWFRRLALAISETYGATPRLGSLISQHPDSAFAHRVRPHRNRIAELIPALRRAQRENDPKRFRTLGDQAITEWDVIREAYLEFAGSGNLRRLLVEWFDAAVTHDAHTPLGQP